MSGFHHSGVEKKGQVGNGKPLTHEVHGNGSGFPGSPLAIFRMTGPSFLVLGRCRVPLRVPLRTIAPRPVLDVWPGSLTSFSILLPVFEGTLIASNRISDRGRVGSVTVYSLSLRYCPIHCCTSSGRSGGSGHFVLESIEEVISAMGLYREDVPVHGRRVLQYY